MAMCIAVSFVMQVDVDALKTQQGERKAAEAAEADRDLCALCNLSNT
jgi:hypothetical protein